MTAFLSALWAEALKAFRSRVLLVTLAVSLVIPLAGGLFMIILKDPAQARSMGLIGAKAQLTMGEATWPAFLGFMAIGTGAFGAVLFAMTTVWVFGREFSDHTVKEWLSLPAPRSAVVAAKYVGIAAWCLILALVMYLGSMAVGAAVGIPGWSPDMPGSAFHSVMLAALLNLMLMPPVALMASAGRGFLPPVAWLFFTLGLADLANVLGWGDWFPWTVPLLAGGGLGANPVPLSFHSYGMVALTFVAGLAGLLAWWRSADQAR
jgi:ABC-2 type transport system permease protein